MLRLKLAAWAFLFASPAVCFAASGDTVTGSGSSTTVQMEDEDLSEERKDRAEGLRTAELQFRKIDAAFRSKLTAFYKKRAEHRSECREGIRRANRDTLFSTLQRCYKGDLTLENDLHNERRKHFESMPGLTKAVRANVLERLDLLISAIDTAVFGIDSGVYDSQETVAQVRTNLRLKYRDPFWDSVLKARADRNLSWVANLIVNLDATIVEEQTAAGSTREALTKARTCLTGEETSLNAVLSSTSKDLSTPLGNIQTCVTNLKAIPKWNATGSGAMVN